MPVRRLTGDSQASDDTVDINAETAKPDVILFDMATRTPWKIRDRNLVLPALTTLKRTQSFPKWRTSSFPSAARHRYALIPYDDFALTDIGVFVFNGGEASAKALIETGQLPTDDEELFSSFDDPDEGRMCIWAAKVCFGGLDLAADASVYYNAVRSETVNVGSSVYVPLTDLQCGQWRQKIRRETHAMAQGNPSKLSFYGSRLMMMDTGRCMPSLGWTDTMSHLEDSGCISRLEQFEKDDYNLRIDLLTFRVLQTWAEQLPTHFSRKVETQESEQARRVAKAVLPGPCNDVPLPRPSKNLDVLALAAKAAELGRGHAAVPYSGQARQETAALLRWGSQRRPRLSERGSCWRRSKCGRRPFWISGDPCTWTRMQDHRRIFRTPCTWTRSQGRRALRASAGTQR